MLRITRLLRSEVFLKSEYNLFGKPVAGHLVTRRQFNQLRLFVLAAFRAVRATVAEWTSRRQVQRTGRFALDILDLLGKVHLGIKDRGQQCP